MDDTELHYLTYDPDAIFEEMLKAYIAAGGDVLYPGDEKEMILRAVQAAFVHGFAGVDNALRMATLRYSVREYLEEYGNGRFCPIIEAQAATATVAITFCEGSAKTIPAGTAITDDGQLIFQLADEITVSGSAQTIAANIVCAQTGAIGNSLEEGTQMQFLVPVDRCVRIVCTDASDGGQDKEDYEAYRERIRTNGLSTVTTGPAQQYEAAAKAVSSDIIDAKALNLGAGRVGVYIIARSGAAIHALIDAVRAALSERDKRPLNDEVIVSEATAIPYTLNVKYASDGSSAVQTAISGAVDTYKAWQETVIGRAFNPEYLTALMYKAGATRVIWNSGSTINGGDVVYTEIQKNEYCKGTISLAVIDG